MQKTLCVYVVIILGIQLCTVSSVQKDRNSEIAI